LSGARCCVVSDARFSRRGSAYWAPRNNFPTGHWHELLSVFDEVTIFARAREANLDVPPDVVLPRGTSVREAPYYVGVAGLVRKLPALLRSVWRLTREDRVFLLRGPGFLSILAALALSLRRKAYCVELLGDSGESLLFSTSRMRAVWARLARLLTRAAVRRASATLYVVGFLRDRYPPGPTALSAVISDARLGAWMFRPPHPAPAGRMLTLVTVANMEQPYKGHTYLFEALAALRKEGRDVRLRLIGEGRLRAQLEQLADTLAIRDAITFHGALPWGEPVFSILDESDLFLLASLTEGMPKALLEAMARGLAAISTAVGGIPEILPAEALFRPADAAAIAERIAFYERDRNALARLADRCHATAEAFREDLLTEKRRTFYRELARRAAYFCSASHVG
jgi:glycosyltransferase involved in cell wall biosynthesis